MLDGQETELVLAAQQGNAAAFGELVKRYQNMVTSLVYSKTGDLQRSEDIAQQAFLTAWSKRTELREVQRFGAWLRSIATHLTLNSNRKWGKTSHATLEMDAANEPASSEGPSEAATLRERNELLWRTLKNIPEEYREPLVLYYREEKSVAQVAERLGLSVDTVKQRLSRGRSMLKDEIEQFVEDLLGASKPGVSFTSAVLLSLPSTSVGVAKTAIQTGIFWGVKSMMGNMLALFAGPMLGVLGGVLGGAAGAAGAWYGTKAAAREATSREEVILLWRFFWTVLVETILLSIASVVAAFWLTESNAIGLFVLVASGLYMLVLAIQIVLFVVKQRQLHQLHGTPAYAKATIERRPASASEYAGSIIASSVGCWIWFVILASTRLHLVYLSAGICILAFHTVLRLYQASSKQTLEQQLRNQANMVFTNLFLSAMLFASGSYFGWSFSPIPNWTVSLFVIAVGAICALFIRFAAGKVEPAAIEPTTN